MMFLPTLIHALARSNDCINKDGIQIYYSALMVRGADPFTQKDHQEDLALKLVQPYVPIVKKTVLYGAKQLGDMQTIILTVAVGKGGKTDGQWQFNGKIMPGLMADARTCGLPTGNEYMMKQFYIFRGTKSAE
jgi:hypothetical protein